MHHSAPATPITEQLHYNVPTFDYHGDAAMPRKRNIEAELADIKRKGAQQVPEEALEMLRLARKDRAMQPPGTPEPYSPIFTSSESYAQQG